MKGLLTLSVIIGFASMSAAASIEADRMDAGIKFNEQIMEAKIDSGKAVPVQMNCELTEVKEAQYNAEAKDFSRLTAKAPAALIAKSDVEKKDGKKEKKRVIVDGLKVAGILLLVGGVIAVCSGSIIAGAIAAGIIFCGGVLMS